jgi:gluconokinase
MHVPGLRSPYDKTGGIYYIGRMFDKIRLHAAGQLPEEYLPNLGKGFDARALTFFDLDYQTIVQRVKQGGSDEELLQWCLERGRHPRDEEIEIWNEFMRKRGWNDDGASTLARRKKESGLENRDDIQTAFDYLDADEGRVPNGGVSLKG